VSGNGNCCISVGMDKSLKLWDLRSYECSISIPTTKYAEMNYVSLKENTKNYSSVRHLEKTSTFNMVKLLAISHRNKLKRVQVEIFWLLLRILMVLLLFGKNFLLERII